MTAIATKPFIKQVTIEGEGCLGYIIGDRETGKAAIIDPRHDLVDEFLSILKKEGLKLEFSPAQHIRVGKIVLWLDQMGTFY